MDGLHHSKQSKKARSRSRVRVHHTMVERSSPLIEGLQNEPEQSTSSLLLPTSISLPPAAARASHSTAAIAAAQISFTADGIARVCISAVEPTSNASTSQRSPTSAVIAVAQIVPSSSQPGSVHVKLGTMLCGCSSNNSNSSGGGGSVGQRLPVGSDVLHTSVESKVLNFAPAVAAGAAAAIEAGEEKGSCGAEAQAPAAAVVESTAADDVAIEGPAATVTEVGDADGPFAAPSPSPVKKKKTRKRQSFHPATKRAGPKYTLARPRVKRGLHGTIDLDVTGQTHRAYSNASNAVRNRKPPQKPPERKKGEEFSHDAWLAAQMALTADMNAKYEANTPSKTSKKAGAGDEPYVPKQRKTQRAKQKPRPSAMGLRPGFDYALERRFEHAPSAL